ncbi:hypothetical protein Lepto7376_2670 [[Leptolyngbya] sp. PCC 7376]|nr:hypothetical protein Lepto7376_2670 [[Leptolyngbya] sp. PCC 7376]
MENKNNEPSQIGLSLVCSEKVVLKFLGILFFLIAALLQLNHGEKMEIPTFEFHEQHSRF